ncbi:Fe2+-dependent dioxygenase [Halioxenophilus sp. WMMB6]|uniref:Fe2+-dependent dioxygenase n=1 Tax=Halioxenophilus sp. WMMB6 TaxID=3073815 RepID=UPI00295F310F|nr:Fe2+-dependent dioxygenase [Halioxenophilus sp. WMMB6]
MVIIEQFLNATEVGHYRQALQQAAWLDGTETALGMASAVKKNLQADGNDPVVKQLVNGLLAKMGANNKLVSAALPHKIFPPCFNSYSAKETYGYHVDAAIMRLPNSQEILRSDVSMTLFLSDPDDYQGGELTIATDYGSQSLKLKAGDAVVYPSCSLHQVTPVTEGRRLAAICWMQSLVPQAAVRDTLFQLDQTIQQLSANSTIPREQLDNLHLVYHNLIRQNAQV